MRKQYVDFLDRFDGGGAGQTGNSFQGGGLLSALGNLLANPYGSEDQARRAQRRQALGLLDTAAAPAPARPAPFAPRTAPPGNITTSVLPPAMTGSMGTSFGAMGNPVDMSRDIPAPPQIPSQIPSHLIGPKVVAIPQPPMPTASVQQPQPVPNMGQQSAALAGEAALMRANEYPQFAAWIDGFSKAYPGQTLNQYAELFLSLQGQQ